MHLSKGVKEKHLIFSDIIDNLKSLANVHAIPEKSLKEPMGN